MSPELGRPVLAEIEYVNDLGKGTYFEVIYHDGKQWCSFFGSKTFEDGEQVIKWIYADKMFELFKPNKMGDDD